MAEFTSFISSGSNGGGVSAPATSNGSALGGVAQVAQVGLNLFAAKQKREGLEAAAAEEARVKAITTAGQQAAQTFTQQASDLLLGGNPIAAQNAISKLYSETQAGMDTETANIFRKAAIEGIGFNPIAQVRSTEVSAEQAAAEQLGALVDSGRDYAMGTLGMPQEVYDSLPVEEQQSLAYEASATTDKVNREVSRLNLMKARGEADAVVKAEAVGVASTLSGDVATQRIDASMATWRAAIESGDPQVIAQTQIKLKQDMAVFKSMVANDIRISLSSAGFTGVSDSDISAQSAAVVARYQMVEDVLNADNWATANRDAQRGAVLAANNVLLNSSNPDESKAGRLLAIDMAVDSKGTLIGGLRGVDTLSAAMAKSAQQNGYEVTDPTKSGVQVIQKSMVQGPAKALGATGANSPESVSAAVQAWGDNLKALPTTNDPDAVRIGSEGILNTVNSALFSTGDEYTTAIKAFMPMIDALADPTTGAAYKLQMEGSQPQLMAYASEFISNALAPSTSKAVTLGNTSDYTFEIDGDSVQVVPPLQGVGSVQAGSPTGGASQAVERVRVSQGFRKPLMVVNKVSLAFQNLYGVPAQVTREAVLTELAQQLNMKIVITGGKDGQERANQSNGE